MGEPAAGGIDNVCPPSQVIANLLGQRDYPNFVSFSLGDGSSSLALYEWDAAAADAGVSPEGAGFRRVSFHYIVASRQAVDEVMSKATAAGGAMVKDAAGAQWGGYFGYFADPDGHLWKVATSSSLGGDDNS
jgi:catechol 2,3-dioxygenase-like lactoylglutathione lyase family enzyme